MGTSVKNSGPGGSSPLIPSWLGGDGKGEEDLPPGAEDAPSPQETPPNQGPQPESPLPPLAPLPAPGEPNRFRSARMNLNKAVRSGMGSGERELRRAVSDYVRKGYGGGRHLSQRVANSTRVAGNIMGFAQSIRDNGFAQAAKEFGCQTLLGKPIEEAAGILIDAFTGPGITTDDNIAREAWCETVKEMIEEGITDFANLPPERWAQAVEIFLVKSIELRIINEIGNEAIGIAQDVSKIEEIERDLESLIRGEVQDKIVPAIQDNQKRSASELNQYVNGIVDLAADYLQALEEEES